VRNEQRAGEIILGLRNLLNNKPGDDLHATDVNDNVRDLVKVISPEVAKRGVVLVPSSHWNRCGCDPTLSICDR
jgi:hypothetical protein